MNLFFKPARACRNLGGGWCGVWQMQRETWIYEGLARGWIGAGKGFLRRRRSKNRDSPAEAEKNKFNPLMKTEKTVIVRDLMDT